MKVAHLTSVHPRYDTRIFLKECSSLARFGYETHLVVADGMGDEEKNNVFVHDVGAPLGRFDRIRYAPTRVLQRALAIHADVYHLHDPELIPIGVKLKKAGKLVVFDAHEDIAKQILSKPYLNKPAKWVLSNSYARYESWAIRSMDAVVAATPYIRDKYLRMGVNSIDIKNYPLLGELAIDEIDWVRKRNHICYVGGISRIRGILEVVQALELTSSGVRLQLGGRFSEKEFEKRTKCEVGWQRVDELGWLDRVAVREVMATSVGGIVTLHPVVNYVDALPVKMFEYMAAGVPVIASDFPLWREIVQGNNCGVCVDPYDPRAIATAIDYLMEHPQDAEKMGRNGQKAVEEKYNWTFEEQKLSSLYRELTR